MKKYINGQYIEITPEEIAAMQTAQAIAEAQEKHRPLTESEVMGMLLRQQVNTLEVDDQMAYRMREFYPEWATNTAYTVGYKAQRNGKLWKAVQPHTSQTGWEPENAASLWENINETHEGTLYDPIPYDGNMALEAGKHYTQNGVTYLCSRDTGNPVYNALAALVGLYVEVAG
jgi:hypothetical protein